MNALAKFVALTVHVVVSVMVIYLIAIGYLSVPSEVNGSTNRGGLFTGILCVLVCGIQAVPLLIAVKACGISKWWGVVHAFVSGAAISLVVVASLFEHIGSLDV